MVKKPWPVWDIAFSPDGHWLAAGRGYHAFEGRPPWGGEGEVMVWRVDGWERQDGFSAPFTDKARTVAFTADGKNLVAASDKYIRDAKGSPWDGNAVFIWAVSDGSLVETLALNDQFDEQHNNRGAGSVTAFALSPNGELVALGRSGSVGVVLQRKTRQRIYDVKWDSGTPHSLAFSPNGKILVSLGYRTPFVQPYEAATGKALARFDLKSGEPVSVGYSPDGKQLAVGMVDGTALLLTGDLTKQLRSLEVSAEKKRVETLAYAAKADLLVAATTTKVRLFEASSGKQIRDWGKEDLRVSSVALSLDGKLLAVGYGGKHEFEGEFRGGYVNIWDTATGRLVKKLD